MAYPNDGSLAYVTAAVPAMATGLHMNWTIRRKDALDALIGIISLRPDDVDDQRGFWLDPAHQQQVYMFEAAERVTAFAFMDMGLDRLHFSNAEANIASARIKEKQGAALIGLTTAPFVEGTLPKQLWVLHRDEWLLRRDPDSI